MAETPESQQNLGAIRTEIEQIRAWQRFQIAASPDCQLRAKSLFEGKIGAPEVYLALADGPLSLDGIMAKTGKSKPWVSKVCTYLHDKGLIARVPDPNNANIVIFTWTDFDRTLDASAIAQKLVKNASSKTT
jgi:hypothetical protein